MCSKLSATIFNQFLSIVDALNTSNCVIDQCGFSHQTVKHNNYTTLNISYKYVDSCDRCFEILVVIDITNICFQDLPSCKWVNYLENIAEEFLHNVCPKECVVVYPEKSCRKSPPVWEPFPCTETRYVIQEDVIPECHEPTIVRTKVCKCEDPCPRHELKTKKKTIIINRVVYPERNCGECPPLVPQ